MRQQSIIGLRLSVLIIMLCCCNCSSDSPDNIIETVDKSGYIKDSRDDQIYLTILIDDQWWMAENLKYLPYVNPPNSDSGIYVYDFYDTNVNEAKQTLNYQTYGVLYNWATAMAIPNQYNSEFWNGSDSVHQGICPDGWHMPSDAEWNQLELFLIKSSELTDSNNVALKIKSDTLWNSNGNGTNETGFAALPTGFRYREGLFDKIGRYGYFWTSNQCPSSCFQSARYKYLVYSDNKIHSNYPSKKNGLPVRCVKN